MGGTINVAIRKRNGETICVERWTNNMSHWFMNKKMFEGDESHVDEYIAMCRNADYVLDAHSLGKPQPLENNAYGIIVFDYMTNMIIDNNDYTNITKTSNYSVIDSDGKLDDSFKELVEDSRVSIDGHVVTYSQIQAALAKRHPDDPSIRFQINPEPMKFLKFDHLDWEPIEAKLIELGFPMTVEEGLKSSGSVPETRDLTSQEKYARMIFRDNKKEGEEFHQYDGQAFDDAPQEVRDRLMEKAKDILLKQGALSGVLR